MSTPYRIYLAGDTQVGKTTLLFKYKRGVFQTYNHPPTAGVEVCKHEISLNDGNRIYTEIWDASGQEKYRPITTNHIRKSKGALLVYDVTRRETFLKLNSYLEAIKDIRNNAPDCLVHIVGYIKDGVLKGETARQVTTEEAQKFADEKQLFYVETSACDGHNVTEVFDGLIKST